MSVVSSSVWLTAGLCLLSLVGCSPNAFVECKSLEGRFHRQFAKDAPIYTKQNLDKQIELLREYSPNKTAQLKNAFVPRCGSYIEQDGRTWLAERESTLKANNDVLLAKLEKPSKIELNLFNEIFNNIPKDENYVDPESYRLQVQNYFEGGDYNLYFEPIKVRLSKHNWIKTDSGKGYFSVTIPVRTMESDITDKSSYIGSNAYGAQVLVSQAVIHKKVISYWNHYNSQEALVRLPVMLAKNADELVNKEIELNVYFRLRPYEYKDITYRSFDVFEYYEPTISDPTKLTIYKKQLLAEVVAVSYNDEYNYYSVW